MHTDLSPHLHTDECNEFIRLLQKCREDHPIGRVLGLCNRPYDKVVYCLKQERIERRNKNFEQSKILQARIKERIYNED